MPALSSRKGVNFTESFFLLNVEDYTIKTAIKLKLWHCTIAKIIK